MHHPRGPMTDDTKRPHSNSLRLTTLLALVAMGLSTLPAAAESPVPTIKPQFPPGALPGIRKPEAGLPSLKDRVKETIGLDLEPSTDTEEGEDAEDAEDVEDVEADTSADDKSTGGDAFSSDGGSTAISPPRQKPPILDPNAKIMLDFVNKPIMDLIKYMAEITGRNFILTDGIKGEVTIISHKPVSVPAAYEAFLSALEQTGYTTVSVGNITKVVSSGNAAKSPIRVHHNGNIPFTDNFVTQVIELENVTVGDISSVVKELMSKDASVISYAPANTLILTDAATNIRKIYRIINQLDIAAPKAMLSVIPLNHAMAQDIQKIIQDLYGTATSGSTSATSAADKRKNRRNSRLRDRVKGGSPGGSSTNVGKEGKYIEKIIADERTNSLIVMANDEAMSAVVELIIELDVDVDPSSRAQIHVVYLEHAKSEDVASVLSNLADSGRSNDRGNQRTRARRTSNPRTGTSAAAGARGGDGADGKTGSATAAFDDGVRITSDENTNSLVIVATQDQFSILHQVIERLDIRRKQVFVEAVVLEIASDDSFEAGIGAHIAREDGSVPILSSQTSTSSLGLSPDMLSGMAVGVYGDPIDVSVGMGDAATTMSVPAFGIALHALQTNSAVNIVSTPNILTMDNEEAKIVVGRNIPFPVSTGRDNNGQAIVSYQREDVAITLKVTPQINESNFVTLEVFQEVQEVEEDNQGLEASTAGFITSKRSAETTVVVRDNQTVVIGGLIGNTETEVETKVPILGDLPLLGMLFRGQRNSSRKTNMLIFLTPHIIDEPEDLEEVYRVKWAQRQEYIKRFYGKSRDGSEAEMRKLLSYSMNQVDAPSVYRTKVPTGGAATGFTTIGADQPVENPTIEVHKVGRNTQAEE
jgi:general secretion pathway protein D